MRSTKPDPAAVRMLREQLMKHTKPAFDDLGTSLRKVRKARKAYPDPTELRSLYDIVVTGKRDIRRVHDAQSLAGAKRFVARYPDREYEAGLRDLDGDGIREVHVTYGGEFILINGYTAVQSDWIKRQAYHRAHDSKEARKQESKGQWARRTM